MQMTKSMLTEYKDRWRSVAQVAEAEQRTTSVVQRWQKLNSLFRMAAGLGILHKIDNSEVNVVRNRWNILKSLHLAELQGSAE